MVATLALVTWSVNVALGLTMLLRWPRPPRTSYVHLATASVGLVAWIAYLATDRPDWLAWAGFVWLIVINALGDVLLLGGWRSRTPEPRPRGLRAYLASASDVLSGRRPVPAAHAVLAPATFVLVFLAALRS